MTDQQRPLTGRVALVAGATRGASRAIAVELARAGAFVYATGRSSRSAGRSEIDRPETIEETGDLIAAVGDGRALVVDHLDIAAVSGLIKQIESDKGRLDILVNGLFGGDIYAQFGDKLWEHDLERGLRMIRLGVDGHVITAHQALPLMLRNPESLLIELTDGTTDYNRSYRKDQGFFYDLVKASTERMTGALHYEMSPEGGAAIAVTPGWLRSEAMLDLFGVREDNWRDALDAEPHFVISESPTFVARGIATLAADTDRARFGGSVVSSFDLASLYDIDDVDGTRPDAWRYIVEVQDPGLPAGDSGYR
ncbi:SDR family oxidoreductase [Prescottella agglutinans]|uniref:NAD(P)-dependent dehydrogenase (Short-subunit alcohol dehydrogenase family) n=1 Tax=Prescottella agglutinans TaxID=1644129 RepID=A0ABT6MG73_9NOCA|nr:SDR family oxidoreductase [Prescottella agglutinans]MDH6283318.1 NAD(P)-dependent dehydrogenase (short-subunit alcohol dehydrogenase family) [Prescottella agglutinans]